MEDSKSSIPPGTLRHKPAFWDLASKRRSGLAPLTREEVDNNSKFQDPASEPEPRKRRPIARLRHSLSNLDVSEKVKQVVGRKRSRDETNEDEDDEQLIDSRPRKRPAGEQDFWNRYRAVRNEHNACEAMHTASRVAHAYDEDYGLDREPPHVNEEALALLEGRVDERRRDSVEWPPGGNWMAVRWYVDTYTFGRTIQTPDFAWAGQEVDDFRLFVTAAENGALGGTL